MRIPQRRSERGSAVVEFALAFALLWLMFTSIYQFGYTFYVYNVLLTSVASAAELGSKMTYDAGIPSTFTNALTNMVVYGNTTAGTTPVVPGLSSSNVSVSVNPANTTPTDITITINNFTVDAVFRNFTFNGKPRATAVYMGQIICSGC